MKIKIQLLKKSGDFAIESMKHSTNTTCMLFVYQPKSPEWIQKYKKFK